MNTQNNLCTSKGENLEFSEALNTENAEKPKTFEEAILKIDLIKMLAGLSIILMMLVIVITLIINPNSLNAQTNALIGIVVGVISTKYSDMISIYFPNKN